MDACDTEYLLVTQYFRPDTARTGQLMTDLATGLQDRGLDMKVLTTQPNYHSGNLENQPRSESIDGVDVVRIRAPQVKQTTMPRRAFNWSIFTFWMFFAVLLSRTEGPREVIFVSNPPFFGLAMCLVCVLRGWDYTYIVHDVWPEKGVEFGFYSERGVIDRSWSWLHRTVFRRATNIVTLGESMKETIFEYGTGCEFADKVTVIHNWEDPEFIEPKPKSENWFSEKHGLVDGFTVLYSGNIGLFHDLETLIKTANKFDESELNIIIIGEGDNRRSLESLATYTGVAGTTVRFLPYQPRDVLPYSLTCSDVIVVSIAGEFSGTCVSSKLYTCLATGQPVLAITVDGSDEATMVERFDAGKQVTPGDVDGVEAAIREWMSDPKLVEKQGSNARAALEDSFSEEAAIDQYYDVITGT